MNAAAEILQKVEQSGRAPARGAIILPTLKQGKRVAWDYMKAYMRNFPGIEFNEAELRADWQGRRLTIIGSDNFDGIRGQYFDVVACDEFDNFKMRAWYEVILPCLSDYLGKAILSGTSHGKGNLYKMIQMTGGMDDWETFIFKASTTGILDPAELKKQYDLMGHAAYMREYECSFDDAEGALWRRDYFRVLDIFKPADMEEIVVAIDPAVTSSERSDETGIVVAARVRCDAHPYHILEDASGRLSVDDMLDRAIALYHHFKADRIVVEKNQGGDFIKHAFINHPKGKAIPIQTVTATRGKHTRAEPIAALYERGLVTHARPLLDLEDQCCTWEPFKGKASPDRMDALVWALTAISVIGYDEPDDLDDMPVGIKERFYNG